MAARQPVLVLGGFITALGTIRSLAAAGIEAFVYPGREPYLRWSRFYRPYPAAHPAPPTAADLRRLLEGHAGEPPVLMPVSDAWVLAVAELGEARWPSSTPPPEAVATLLDKGQLSRTLARLGILHPRTSFVSSLEEARAALGSRIEDAFLKPCDSYACQAAFGKKAWRVSVSTRSPSG